MRSTNIICPHCTYVMTGDDMEKDKSDLWAICPREEDVDIKCPSCGKVFFCTGGYIPQYETRKTEEEDL